MKREISFWLLLIVCAAFCYSWFGYGPKPPVDDLRQGPHYVGVSFPNGQTAIFLVTQVGDRYEWTLMEQRQDGGR